MDIFWRLAPAGAFFLLLTWMSFRARRRSADARSKDFFTTYFIGGRSLGGFVLAMTIVATYSSVSSFLGGVGMAWQNGFGWVYFASTQVAAAYLVLGVLGKKMAVVGRRIKAVTVIDVIRARYHSEALAVLCAIVLLVFFTTMMLGQFIGGARLFAEMTGLPYAAGLLIFAFVVIFYTAIGGFGAVAWTDTACAVVMLVGTVILTCAVLAAGGGIDAIMADIESATATGLLDPESGGRVPLQLLLSQWLLCGACTLGLPQSQVRCLGYKDSAAVRKAMIYGSFVVGFMMIGIHLVGILSRGAVASIDGSTDSLVPLIVSRHMLPVLGGIAVVGPLAATMSTISSLLIAGSGAIVKDLYIHHKLRRGAAPDPVFISRFSTGVTAVMGIAAVALAIYPPGLIVWINLFSFGGLEVTFFWVMLLGFYWPRANALGALLSVSGGLAAYCITLALNIRLGQTHNIVIGIGVSLLLFIIGSLLGRRPDDPTRRLFFPETFA